jgi:hypothetical protein
MAGLGLALLIRVRSERRERGRLQRLSVLATDRGRGGYKLYAAERLSVVHDDRRRAPAAGTGAIHYVHGGLLVESTNTFAISSYNAAGTRARSNEMAIAYPVAAGIVDSDGDGLTDAREDVNLNTTRDAARPIASADTDGDGASDGSEVATGTDPLNAASRPGVATATRTATPVRTATATPLPTKTNEDADTHEDTHGDTDTDLTRTATPVATTTSTTTPSPSATRTPTRTPTVTPTRTATRRAPGRHADAHRHAVRDVTPTATSTPSPTATPIAPYRR